MQSIIIILLLFICASLPIKSIINWTFNFSELKPQEKINSIHFPSNIFRFLFIESLNFLLGFGLFYISEKLFYFQTDLFILTSFILILIGFYFSIFNKFNAPNNSFFFLFGVYVFFSQTFIWLIPILFLSFSLLFNSIYLGYFFTILCSFSGLILFETNYLFLGSNFLILIIYCLRFYSNLINSTNQYNSSLLHLFKQRT